VASAHSGQSTSNMPPLEPMQARPVTPIAVFPPEEVGNSSSSFPVGHKYDVGQGAWNHAFWLREFEEANVGYNAWKRKKDLRKDVADHNYELKRRKLMDLGKVSKTVRASPDEIAASRAINNCPQFDPVISFSHGTTGEALAYFARQGETVCGLNYANGQSNQVGGGYVRGAKAQEEDLCRTFPLLYSSLLAAKKKKLYPYGPAAVTYNSLKFYADVLYTQDVLCCRAEESQGYRMLAPEERFCCSFISAAAPNLPRGELLNEDLFKSAIRNMLVAPKIHGKSNETVFVGGAWGCGAFEGNPKFVAACFIEALQSPLGRLWKEIHFCIPLAADNDNAANFYIKLREAFPNIVSRKIP